MASSDAAQKILEAGQARTDHTLPQNASIKANPAAMADKVLKEGARTLGSQAAKGEADTEVAGLAQAATQANPKKAGAAEIASEVKAAVHSSVPSQQKNLSSSAVAASAEKLNRKPHDKQTAGGDDMHQNAVNILADAESELVRQEVKDKGGVVRGSTAAKVQSAADRVREGTAGGDPAILTEIKESLKGTPQS